MNISVITVVTDYSQYNQLIVHNPHVQTYTLRSYDNSQDNLPIPVRYNHFIENELPEDGWIIFCHQDFEFLQNPTHILQTLDKNCIYGPIGVAQKSYPSYQLTFHTYRILPSLKRKTEIRSKYLGQIHEGTPDSEHLAGQWISVPTEVDTLDCCCLLVHSSLIRQYKLRFDPIFDFHLYAEDFCLAAKQHGIVIKALQLPCRHYSSGKINSGFWTKYHVLLSKYPDKFFLTTCVSDPRVVVEHLLKDRWDRLKTIV